MAYYSTAQIYVNCADAFYMHNYTCMIIRTYAYSYTHIRIWLYAHMRMVIRTYAYIYTRIYA